jgi:anti-sigma B factor antagonist
MMDRPELQVLDRQQDLLIVSFVSPRLDFSTAYVFKNAMLDLISQGERKFVIDLGQVETMDAKGLSAILFCCRAIDMPGFVLLAGLEPRVRSIFAMTRVDTVVPVFDRIDAALASLAQSGDR